MTGSQIQSYNQQAVHVQYVLFVLHQVTESIWLQYLQQIKSQ